MAQIKITVSPFEMTALNQARAKAGFDTFEQFVTAVVKDCGTDQKVIAGYAKANQVEKKKAADDDAAEKNKVAAKFRAAQRKAKAKEDKKK